MNIEKHVYIHMYTYIAGTAPQSTATGSTIIRIVSPAAPPPAAPPAATPAIYNTLMRSWRWNQHGRRRGLQKQPRTRS